MKIKFLILVVICLSAASICSAQRNVPNPIVGTFQSARIVQRVKRDDKWWMVVYVNFKIKNALSNPCKMYAYFYNEADGKPLKAGKDARYRTTSGFVTASADFTPGHTDATYTEFKIYVPYEALNLDSTRGNLFNLKYFLTMYDDDAKAEIAKSPWYKFSLQY